MRHFDIVEVILGCSLCACSSSPAASDAEVADAGTVDARSAESGIDDPSNPLPGCPRDPGPADVMEFNPASSTDPVGRAKLFTLEQALSGYPQSEGVLTALITTEFGTIRCELDEKAAPMTVANFVGLARGTRPYMRHGAWRVGRFYDGLIWHRILPTSVIVGGDPMGTGNSGPGYDLVPENQVAESHGTLAMSAMAMPSGSQFHIVVAESVPSVFNVFGKCGTAKAIVIANQPRTAADKPSVDIHTVRVDIARCPK